MDVEVQRARRTEARRHDWLEIADRIATVIRERIATGEASAS
jgi:hypothetical protein